MVRNSQVDPEDGRLVNKKNDCIPDYEADPGPQDRRKLHDVFWLILFVLFWIGMLVIAGFAIHKGDINRLRYGTDSYGNRCGTTNKGIDATDLEYLYYFEPGVSSSLRICVSACPSDDFTTGSVVCQYGITSSSDYTQRQTQLQQGSCVPAIKTIPLLHRCAPNITSYMSIIAQTSYFSASDKNNLAAQVVTELNNRNIVTSAASAISASWKVILISSAVAFVVSFIWLLVLQFIGALTVWATVLLVNLTLMLATAFLWYCWFYLKTGANFVIGIPKLDSFLASLSAQGVSQVNITQEDTTWFMVFAIVVSVITAIVFLLCCFSVKRIRLAIQIIKEASKGIRAMPLIMILPIMKYIALALLFALFVYIMALLSSSGTDIVVGTLSDAAANNVTAKAQAYVSQYSPDKILAGLQLYYLFGLFWTMNWIVGIGQCTIAGAVATWYWTRDKRSLPGFPVFRALGRTLRYHLGSVALGALTIAIVQMMRFGLSQIQARLRGSQNKAAMYIMTCLQCCFACLEKILKFINKNAYIMIAVYGYSFCNGARVAFDLLVRNAFRVVVIDGVASFLLFLGQLLITAITCVVGLYLLQTQTDLSELYAVPLLLIAILSWIVSSGFVSVVHMAINTIFLCFCEDCERNDGTKERPYYMSESLRVFTEAHRAPKL